MNYPLLPLVLLCTVSVVLCGCPSGYTPYGKTACFYYGTFSSAGTHSKTEADMACARRSFGVLASIDKEQGTWFANAFMSRNVTNKVWLGLSRHNHVWSWNDGSNRTNVIIGQERFGECVFLSAKYDNKTPPTNWTIGLYNADCNANSGNPSSYLCQVHYAEDVDIAACWRSHSVLAVAVAALACLLLILICIACKW